MRPARSPRALQYCHERAMRLLEEGPGLHEVAFMLKVGWCSVRGWRPAAAYGLECAGRLWRSATHSAQGRGSAHLHADAARPPSWLHS